MARHELKQHFVEAPARLYIEVTGGLISQQDRGLESQGTRYSHPLLLTTRQLGRTMLQALPEADLVKKLESSVASAFGRLSADEKGHHHVLDRSEVPKKMMKLEYESDGSIPKVTEVGIAQSGEVVPAESNPATGRTIEPSQYMQEC